MKDKRNILYPKLQRRQRGHMKPLPPTVVTQHITVNQAFFDKFPTCSIKSKMLFEVLQ